MCKTKQNDCAREILKIKRQPVRWFGLTERKQWEQFVAGIIAKQR